jgi:hypothetical protein
MTTVRDNLEKQLTQLKREVLTRGFDRHPSVLKYVSELPAELQSPAVTTLVTSKDFQTIIAFPPQIHRGWHYVPKQALLFTPTEVIHLLASIWPNQIPQITCINVCSLLYMRITLILLYGLLEIVAQGNDLPTRLSMEFNTVIWYRLSQPLWQMLHSIKATPSTTVGRTAYPQIMQDALKKLPLKFSNGVKIFGLLPGDELEELVFQSAPRKRWQFLIRRPDFSNTLLLLTNNFIVVIQEDPDVRQGWIISYLPRINIAGIYNRPRSPGKELIVQLKREEQTAEYKLFLKSETILAWRERWLRHNGQWQNIPDEVEK